MTETTTDLGDVKHLAATLDAVDLEERDRATLHAIFALAGQATAGGNESEVSGFAFDASNVADGLLLPAVSKGVLGGGTLIGSFQWGLGRTGGDVQPIDY